MILVGRILTQYIEGLSCLAKVVLQHITHKYFEISGNSTRHTDENCHSDMVEIMSTMHDYLGKEYPSDRRVVSGGDYLTCERQLGAQQHVMDGS